MAAKLHMQQVHSGGGSVEAGPGPGQDTETPPRPVSTGPPVSPSAPIVQQEERKTRERPTPRPLHQASNEISVDIMRDMLAVWDKIGPTRVGGAEAFVHSSMIMKVYAAKPSNVMDEAAYEPYIPDPKGANPFAGIKDRKQLPYYRGAQPAPGVCPFAIAKGVSFTEAFVTPPCANPFLHIRPVRKKEKVDQVEEEATEAPKTEYGQLGKFDPEAIKAGPSSAQEPLISPFAAAATAASEVSPFASAAQTANPFSSGQAASSFASLDQVASPFAQTSASSPFAQTSASSPFGEVLSPFGAFPEDTNGMPPQSTKIVNEEEEKKFVCNMCGRAFKTEFGLAGHSKDKHNIDIPESTKNRVNRMSKKEKIPELPAYIPSPVDLASTSPFGVDPTQQAAMWSDVELIPHSLLANNITLVGEVQEWLEKGPYTYVSVKVDDEVIMVSCDAKIASVASLEPSQTICVVGTLRLHPTLDETTSKVYSAPVVHVSTISGTLSAM